MSSTKIDRERQKVLHDKCVVILDELLRDEDNKYCVDCDAKGPRWASWNLGVFLCIRCAGIHRNLGVHVSKVKSVNLDSWLPDQVASLQQMGNSKARAIYEARLPDNFRRPQTDSTLESFIRAKYETKKYLATEWVPPKSPAKAAWASEPAIAPPVSATQDLKKKSRTKEQKARKEEELPSSVPALIVEEVKKPAEVKQAMPKSQSLIDDLLSLDDTGFSAIAPTPTPLKDSLNLDMGPSPTANTPDLFEVKPGASEANGQGKMSKESILALYQTATSPMTSSPSVGFQQPAMNAFQSPGPGQGFFQGMQRPPNMGFPGPQASGPSSIRFMHNSPSAVPAPMANGFAGPTMGAPRPFYSPQPQAYSQQLIDQMKKLGMKDISASPGVGNPWQPANPVSPMMTGPASLPTPSSTAQDDFGLFLGSTPGQTMSKNLWQ